MKPTVGRIVHYIPEWAGSGQPYAKPLPAIITEVLTDGETVRLGVFGSTYFPACAIHIEPTDSVTEYRVPGAWFWPPREG